MMEAMIDLRSDSSSSPTDLMRQAMAKAEVGNDAFGEDPTVNELEKRAAELLDKESALLVSSGTMGNIVAVMTAASAGETILAGRQSHLVRFEAGSAAKLGGVFMVTFPDENGRIDPEEIRNYIHLPMSLTPRLLVIENTHNCSGGLVLGMEEMEHYQALAAEHRMHLHLDGSRIFNAASALKLPAATIASTVDSVSFCLSKGLSCPVGSILLGKQNFIKKAREIRFLLGGQMRKVGILAAAGLVAFDTMLPQISIDHENAKILAKGLASLPGIKVSLDKVQTNIVLFDVSELVKDAKEFEDLLEARGVFASVFSDKQIRFITYRDIDRMVVEDTLEICEDIVKELRSR
jgi:threonine aldolase